MSETGHCNGPAAEDVDQNVPLLIVDEDQQDTRWTQSKDHGLPTRTAFYYMALHFLLAFAELAPITPMVKLFERSLCISYYEIHDPSGLGLVDEIPEHLCKILEIQTSLASIRGWKSMLDTVSGITLSAIT